MAGLTVVDLSSTLPGAEASQFLADCGADVVLIEPPGGSPVRAIAGWPGLLRGKRSVQLDLHDDDQLDSLRGLLRGADVMITTVSPSTMDPHEADSRRPGAAVSAADHGVHHGLGQHRSVARLQGLRGPGHGQVPA